MAVLKVTKTEHYLLVFTSCGNLPLSFLSLAPLLACLTDVDLLPAHNHKQQAASTVLWWQPPLSVHYFS